ncbi:MAG: endonuclease III domain-containing protein [Patescibacteria group bacterium]|nr:endonuclease III domain-containing protein [Patescibacteria group bacterium]
MNPEKIYKKLLKKYGPQDWWPILGFKISSDQDIKILRKKVKVFSEKNMFEICMGAILTQNTNWQNVEKAIINLKKENLLSPQKILNCHHKHLKKLVRPSGYFNVKAKKLKMFSKWLLGNYQGRLKKFFKQPLKECRKELLKVYGIGPETADSILLYAGRKKNFMIDAYTVRLCKKHGIEFKSYDQYKEFFEKRLPWSNKIYNQFHALIVRWGQNKTSTHKKID